MNKKILILTIGLVFIFASVLLAQWPDEKMHFPQLPDLIGWDVYGTGPIELADDWQCDETGMVKDIHFWGSWKDQDGDPGTDDLESPAPIFTLTIYSNIPVGPNGYSIPGEPLWGPVTEQIQGVPSEPPTLEGWYDPATGLVANNDHIPYWQYDYILPEPIWFPQVAGEIYWLGITAQINDPAQFQWGWKNSRDHFMDDAVWKFPLGGEWQEMYEPPRFNEFHFHIDDLGMPFDEGSTNYYGQGWYFYEQYEWWNIWFYNNPYTPNHPKEIVISVAATSIGDPQYATLTFALNYSTELWSLEGIPGQPPLPADIPPQEEDLYIIREEYPVPIDGGPVDIPITIPWNPEWVSIDVRGTNVIINGSITHECVGTSLDLAFVITGGAEQIPTLNEWGMIILGLLLLLAGTIALVRRRKAVTKQA